MLLLYISILIIQSNTYIVIPLKSTDNLYISKLPKTISINSKEIINEIFHRYIYNVLYTDLTIGEPNQKATAFIFQDNYGFSFFEEFSMKELEELGYLNYNSYSKNKSKTIIHSNELNYDFNFWTYLSYEEIFYLYKFDEKDVFNTDKFDNIKLTKTNNRIHFLYSIRNSSKIPNSTDFINIQKKFEEEKEELKKLNFSDFSYFSIGINFDFKSNINKQKTFIEEFYSKKEITSKDWTIYFNNSKNLKNKNEFNIFLIIGSSPQIYLSNIFNEKEIFSTYSEQYTWSNSPTLSFYKIYTKNNDTDISLVQNDKTAILNYNFGLIRATWYVKTILDKIYFNNLIKQRKCFESEFYLSQYSYYGYYYCDKNKITKAEINNFPGIYFNHIVLDNIFELTSDDLFETFGDIIILKIVFDTSSYWVFGKVFLSKYMFSFNEENKKIFFYNKNTVEDDNIIENGNNKEQNKYLTIQIIVVIICVIIFSFLGFYFGKLIYNKKKIAHELDDIEESNFIDKEE